MDNYYVPRQAGFIITSIGGKRCTGVPRNNVVPAKSTTSAAAQIPKTTAAATKEKVTNTAGGGGGDNAAAPTTAPSPSTSVPATDDTEISSGTIRKTISSSSSIPSPEAITDTTLTDSNQGQANPTSSPSGGTKAGTDKSTPNKSSGGGLVGTGTSATASGRHMNTDSPTDELPAPLPGTNGGSRTNPAPIVGGVVGALILLALIGIILFCCRRRRQKRRNPDLFLSPPGTATREKFYEIDSGSVGPTKRSTRWKHEISSRAEHVAWDVKATVAGFGTSLRATVSRDRGDSPTGDLGRGSPQFYRDSVNSQNRNNSIHSANSGRSSLRERLAEWRKRFGETKPVPDQENQARGPLSQMGSTSESRAPTALDRYRDSDQSGSTATKDLGLSLMNSQTSDLLKLENQPRDPFADPYADPFCDPKIDTIRETNDHLPLSNPFAAGDNPFSDTAIITNPPLVVPKPQTYIQQVRQSRGPSMSSSNRSSKRSSRSTDLISFVDRPPSIISLSQFPSVAVPSHTHDRDTIYSALSNERRGKGRSDPFDLERPDLWILPSQQRTSTLNSPMGASRIRSMIDQNKARAHHRYNSSVRYSSGVNSLEDWGDPADYEDQSVTSSVRGNASSRGGNDDYGSNDVRTVSNNKIYGHQAINGSLTEINVTLNEDFGKKDLERRRNIDNVSPVSALSVEVGGRKV